MKLVKIITVESEQAGQRVDNFLLARLKTLPKARVYRAIRKGEVRVNKKRVKPEYRVKADDQIRIPPIEMENISKESFRPEPKLLEFIASRILFENDQLLIINKPAGLPVHGGNRVSIGLIEMLRLVRPDDRFLELVHRLDQNTSGCLLIAKKRRILVELHRLLTQREVKKQYLVLVKGQWQGGQKKVSAPLLRDCFRHGERLVEVSDQGKPAITLFRPLKKYAQATLLEAFPVSGRTHQIRVHAAHLGHPVAADEKYGDEAFNKEMNKIGLKRLFLHSASISCDLPNEDLKIGICALLDPDLKKVLNKLDLDK